MRLALITLKSKGPLHFNYISQILSCQVEIYYASLELMEAAKRHLSNAWRAYYSRRAALLELTASRLSNDIRSIKAHIGFIPDDENWFISELCATEYFELLARIYSEAGATASMPSNVIGYATSLGFTAFKTPLRMLSHGNKKKVQLIAGLMHEPSVVIVDELRNGLDPLAILAAEELILQQAARGACIIAATHDLWWAERIAQEVAFMHNGSVLIHGDTPSLLRTYGSLESMFRQKIGHA
jgi:ABC-type multidrug transport system ATPase subunit